MSRYLISGVAGFLGYNFAERLLAEGHEIVGLDNMKTGSERNLKLLERHKRCMVLDHDICKPFFTTGTPNRFDYVVNFACPASPPKYYLLWQETIDACTIGVKNLLLTARANHARFLQTSTSEIYGDAEVSPQVEEYWGKVAPYGPRAVYDESKRMAEMIIWWHRRAAEVPHVVVADEPVNTAVVRIFNTYGPGMDPFDGRVVSNFIRQALSGENITIHGTGTQTRSFCYVDDLIEFIYRMLHSEHEGPINIGNPEEFNILELAEMVIRLTGNRAGIIFKPADVADPSRRCPDISKAIEFLDYEPRVQLEEGILRTIDWFRSLGYGNNREVE